MDTDQRPEVVALLAALKAAHPQLDALLRACSDENGYEDPVYRYYHQSMKVYRLQQSTERIVSALQALAPDRTFHKWFAEIVAAGTGHRFAVSHNKAWAQHARPIVEAFFHARFFLEMAVRYGRELDEPPAMLPSGWAALLYLYNLR